VLGVGFAEVLHGLCKFRMKAGRGLRVWQELLLGCFGFFVRVAYLSAS
jgi:predicted cobalt transporter CbtA